MIEGHDVVSTVGGCAAGPAEAARVGARILEQGGNAFDAAAAAAMACCILQPASTGIGGYCGCAVVKEGASGRVWSVDGNAQAPRAVSDEMYRPTRPAPDANGLNEREYNATVANDENIYGSRAIAMPGMAAAMGTIHERWGRLKWAEIVAPCRQLVEDGFPYAATAGQIRSMREQLRRFPETEKHLMPEGKEPSAEDIWHRPDMEWTLRRLAEAGWQDFYQGEIARRIADHIQATGGMITLDDLAGYEARVTEPLSIEYHGARVHTPILPNGGHSVLQHLKMWEQFESVEIDSWEFWHRFIEVSKLAWRDRLQFLADPDFADVPAERLLSADYCYGRTQGLRDFPHRVDRLDPARGTGYGHGTLHLSTADAEGNLVSFTITQGMAFGSLVTIPGTGLIIGHGMCRFNPWPGTANSVAPGKRVLNNTGTMLIEMPQRDVAIGLPGGRKIISAASTIAMRVIDCGATGFEAATGARCHVEAAEPVMLSDPVAPDVRGRLLELGHSIDYPVGVAGGCHAAEFSTAGEVRAGGNTWAAAAEGMV